MPQPQRSEHPRRLNDDAGNEAAPGARDAAVQASDTREVAVPSSTRALDNGRRPNTGMRLRAAQGRQVSLALAAASETVHLPLLTRGSEKSRLWSRGLFAVTFAIPVSLVTLYYVFIASDVYQTQFKFSVLNGSSSQAPSALSSAMSIAGVPSNNDEINYQVADYLTSSAAAEAVRDKLDLRQSYGTSSADWLSRYDDSLSSGDFEPYWKSQVNAQYEQVTGIVSVSVNAFTARDSFTIATALQKAAEDLVNGIQRRSLEGGVQSARSDLTTAQRRLEQAHLNLTAFRKSAGVIDPNLSLVASNSALTQALQSSLSDLKATYDSLVKQKLDPAGPIMTSLAHQTTATKEQMLDTEMSVAKARNAKEGNREDLRKDPLSSTIAEYEKVNQEYQFAQGLVTSALGALEQAKINASTQHFFITPYLRPSLPTSPQLPNRLLHIILTAVACLVIWFLSYVILSDRAERPANAAS